ncbi:MAG TPA: thioredoxin family protein [Myxococcota bacterium]|jgi:thiol-disulfide isomerase/thioredoxin|nr:thioredoxin family protein [Myxococcota bacterium]
MQRLGLRRGAAAAAATALLVACAARGPHGRGAASTAPRRGSAFTDLRVDAALAAAAASHRVVVVDFFTKWCKPCKVMDETAWKDARVRAWMGAHAVGVRVDAEEDRSTAKRYDVRGFPTVLVLRADGTEVERLVGSRETAVLLAALDAAKDGKDAVTRAGELAAGGGATDPEAHLAYARALIAKDRPAEALPELLWCFDRGGDTPSFAETRLDDVVPRLGALAPKLPAAGVELRRRRDDATLALSAAGGAGAPSAAARDAAVRGARDVAALNLALGEATRTLALYDTLRAGGPATATGAEALLPLAAPLLADAHRYADLLAATGDVAALVTRTLEEHDAQEATLKAAGAKPASIDARRAAVVERLAVYYEALLGVGRRADADALAARLYALDGSSATRRLLERAAANAGAAE